MCVCMDRLGVAVPVLAYACAHTQLQCIFQCSALIFQCWMICDQLVFEGQISNNNNSNKTQFLSDRMFDRVCIVRCELNTHQMNSRSNSIKWKKMMMLMKLIRKKLNLPRLVIEMAFGARIETQIETHSTRNLYTHTQFKCSLLRVLI